MRITGNVNTSNPGEEGEAGQKGLCQREKKLKLH